MYFKIAFKNVKKSFKDYTIYFLTLTLAVCIFYSFNSIESQKAMMDINSVSEGYVKILSIMISCVSVFVAFILGSLILYANNFLIKNRNKEMGMYMTLGMSKYKISMILIMETLIVGVLSLVSGLIIGLVVSQGLSVLVAKLFDVKMSGYAFIISTPAIGKTILYFGIMFILVMIFNSFVISKYKIIDLLTVGRKTEEVKFKNPFIYLLSFVLSITCLVISYKFVLEVGLINIDNPKLYISIILGIVGTVLFFFSLSGIILYIVKKSKKIYFKGLNIFTIKQINSKVNTNFLSMSVICLMLFLTIGVLSAGFGFKNALESGLEKSTPFDASAYIYLYSDEDNIMDSLNHIGVKLDKNDKVVYFNEYIDGTLLSSALHLNDKDMQNMNYDISYVKISDYNAIRKLNNKKPISLKENEVLITSNASKILPLIKDYMKNNNTINLGGNIYNIKNKYVIEESLQTDVAQNNMFTVIMSDNLCNNKEKVSSHVNINFVGGNKEKREENFSNTVQSYNDSNQDYGETPYVHYKTRNLAYEDAKGMTTTILFVGIYIGIVFLISSMAVLALQQLSEASESIERYRSLNRLGANLKSINKTIFVQTLVYFSIPVVLAIVHSIIGIKVANDFIFLYGKPNIESACFITGSVFMVVYAIYFYVTYSGYKNIVKNNI